MHDLLTRLFFASDAALLAFAGFACLAVAGFALVMDRRRGKRGRLDAVGWMPWLPLFIAFGVSGAGMLSLGLPVLIASW